ncbi:hypothetical protein JTB14_028855 [Gonioctena quinquepunctata]|nr:hypothetical protein JTB14_028855 [Gonioctena quinquepunctata]
MFAQCALILADHDENLQTMGYQLGKNLALAYQASLDYSIFLSENDAAFELICAPLMFHIHENCSYYEILRKNVENKTVDYKAIITDVKSGSAMEKTIELKREFALKALNVVGKFPENTARLALADFIKSI